jgi:hypothetical protein
MASKNQIQGIILLVIAVVLWAPLPALLPWDTLAALALLVLGIYNLLIK